MNIDLNGRAKHVADQLEAQSEELGCTVTTVGGARIIDAGIECTGTIESGLALARVCMADLGSATVVPGVVGVVPVPHIAVNVTHPVAACMASQYAGWQIRVQKYFAMGSGPMRAARGSEDLFDEIGYREDPSWVVGVLESSVLPVDAVVSHLAQECGVDPERLTLITAPTASLAGGVQVVARSVETALHKLHELQFDLSRVAGGYGWAPLPPVAVDDLAAIGRTNDAMLYGARCTLYVRGDDETVAAAGAKLPSSASPDYGQPFAEIFKRYDHDFYKIDPMLFSPAQVSLQNIETGRTHTVGQINVDVLSRSFFG